MLVRPWVWLSGVLLAASLAAGAVAATSGPAPLDESRAAAAGDVVSLTDGTQVDALEAPAADTPAPAAEVEGAVEAALADGERVSVIVRLRQQADLPAVAARARSA